jgi:peroxiredoxin
MIKVSHGFRWLIAGVAGVVAVTAFASEAPEKAELDKPVAEFKLKNLAFEPKAGEKEDAANGPMVALSKFKDKKNVVLFFMSEKCRATWKYETRVGKLMKDMEKKDVAFLGVRCSAKDTPEGLVKFAEARNFDMPILNDENGEMTKFFGIRNTPAFAVLDKKGVLRYRGGFDDSAEESAVKSPYVPQAVAALLEGKDVPVKEARAVG